ncbi:hypothetical protein [Enterobacter cloacae complex sp. 288G10]|uniref:hypothetical protein n=1 Tax=Enterobacter cloacae complex sp. 288G10 TaxID=3395859 RepID=UPI003CF42389
MTKLNYLKPVASVLISVLIATAGSVYITSKYFKTELPSNDEVGKVAATYLVKNPQYLLEAGKALENQNTNASLERIIPYAPALFETKETPTLDRIMRPSPSSSFSTTSAISV